MVIIRDTVYFFIRILAIRNYNNVLPEIPDLTCLSMPHNLTSDYKYLIIKQKTMF